MEEQVNNTSFLTIHGELGYDEVVDTIADALEFLDWCEDRLEDGAGFDDAIALVGQYPKLQEIYEDRKTFAAQFLDLDANETQAAVRDIAKRVGKEEDVVRTKGIQALQIADRTFRLYHYAKGEGIAIFEDARRLIGKAA